MAPDPDSARRWLRAHWPSVTVAIAVAGLVAYAFARRYAFLTDTPYPIGIDGYFYPIQLRSLLENGALYYPSAPLTLWFMLPFAAATDPVTGAKIGAALGTALLAVPAYLLGRRLSGDRAIGLLASALIVTSAESFYLTVEFVKNGIGLTVAAFYVWTLVRALDAPGRLRVATAIALFIATLLAHKMAGALALIATVPPVYAWARSRGWRPGWRDRSSRIALVSAVAAIGALVGVGAVAPERFVGADDVALLSHLFTGDADFTLPALHVGRYPPLYFGHEVAIAGLLGVAALALAVAARRRSGLRVQGVSAHDRALFVGPAAIALFVALPWIDVGDGQNLGFRLRLVAFFPLALCAAAVAGRALARTGDLVRAALVVGFAVGWLASRPPTTTEGMVSVKAHMQAAVLAASDVVPADDVIICPERHIMYMITWYTRSYARLRPEPVPAGRRWRMFPSAFLNREMRAAVLRAMREAPGSGVPPPRGLHPRDPVGVVLMPEATWEWIMKRVSPKTRARYTAWHTI